MKNENIKLSVVIPAYNEESNILSTLQDISEYLDKQSYGYEIIIVDDGSTDKTADIAGSCAKLFNSFTLLKNIKNQGKGYSVKRGVLAAGGEYVLFMDADNATRICQVDKLMDLLKEGCDVAMGSRRVVGAEIGISQPIHRIALGNIYIMLSAALLGTTVRDYNCGFKLYTKDAARLLFNRLTRNDWSFDSELIYLISKLGLKAKEVGIIWQDKKTSKVRPLRDGMKSFLSLLAIRLNAMRKIYD
jgi:dolichyl-phosphate beta-glucosyltransferase